MVAGGLMQRAEAGSHAVVEGAEGDPLHASRVVRFAKVRSTCGSQWQVAAT